MLMRRKLFSFIILIMAILVVGCNSDSGGPNAGNGQEVTIFKSPTCGCCVGHADYLENEGYYVDVQPTEDLEPVKQRYNIPESMQSCHTAVIGDYFVEGHVPQEAIDKLLTEKPDIDGIALPRMPAGSPGMPGIKSGTWTIFALKDGQISEFMKI
jgi:hypothetical protein